MFRRRLVWLSSNTLTRFWRRSVRSAVGTNNVCVAILACSYHPSEQSTQRISIGYLVSFSMTHFPAMLARQWRAERARELIADISSGRFTNSRYFVGWDGSRTSVALLRNTSPVVDYIYRVALG